ncbi:MAG: hypothetical protein JWO41_336 [Candidatus Saccharibacteria bacterium]|nr:hypothetical protein [Candidatus Saccharibacteria bacterium]
MAIFNLDNFREHRKDRRQVRDALDADNQLFW